MYFLLATCLFPEVGYRLVWDKLVGGLAGMPVASPSAKKLRDLRRRLGTAPMRALFEVLAGPLARPMTPRVRFGGRPEQPPLPAVSRDDRNAVPSQRRRHRILALLQDDPTRLWRVAEIAARFGDIRLDTMYRQLSRWADSGLIHKIGPGPSVLAALAALAGRQLAGAGHPPEAP